MPDSVQELVKVLMAALQTYKKKAPQGKGKLQNKQAGAGIAQLAPNPGNTQVKSRVDRATARCNKCTGIGHFARECPSDKYLNSTRGENQAPPKPRPAGPKPECSCICTPDAGSKSNCHSTGVGHTTTVETHKAQKRVQGVKKGEKGKGGPKSLREERNRSNHMKGKKGIDE